MELQIGLCCDAKYGYGEVSLQNDGEQYPGWLLPPSSQILRTVVDYYNSHLRVEGNVIGKLPYAMGLRRMLRRTDGNALLQKRYALHACNLKALAAAQVLAHQHIVSPQHVRLRFCELRPVAIVRSRRQVLFLHAHQPLDLILRRLMAMRTT